MSWLFNITHHNILFVSFFKKQFFYSISLVVVFLYTVQQNTIPSDVSRIFGKQSIYIYIKLSSFFTHYLAFSITIIIRCLVCIFFFPSISALIIHNYHIYTLCINVKIFRDRLSFSMDREWFG